MDEPQLERGSEPEAAPSLFGSQERTLARMMASMDANVRWLLLLGNPGSGKSTVLNALLGEIASTEADVISCHGFEAASVEDLVAMMRRELRLAPRRMIIPGRVRALKPLLEARRRARRPLVVLIDDAHLLSSASLELLAGLAAKSAQAAAAVYVVLAGMPALAYLGVRAWRARAGDGRLVVCKVPELTPSEVREHVEQRLRRGGRGSCDVSDAAIARIARYTRHRPGRIDILCEGILLQPVAGVRDQVAPDVVDEIARRSAAFDLEGPAGPPEPVEPAPPRRRLPTPQPKRRPDRAQRRWLLPVAALLGVCVVGLLVTSGRPTRPGGDLLESGVASREVVLQGAGPAPDRGPAPTDRRAVESRALAGRAVEPGRPPAARPQAKVVGTRATVMPAAAGRRVHVMPSPDAISALFTGARTGQVDLVTRALDSGVSVDVRDADRFTPLMRAAEHGTVSATRFLLDRGADLDARSPAGLTPLMLAIIHERRQVAGLLLARGADANAESGAGWNPMRFAILKDNDELVRLLRRHGAPAGGNDEPRRPPPRSPERAVRPSFPGEAFANIHEGDWTPGAERESRLLPPLEPAGSFPPAAGDDVFRVVGEGPGSKPIRITVK